MCDTFVSVRFSPVGKLYHFNAKKISDIKTGDQVVVETSRGWQLGVVACILEKTPENSEGGIKVIDRKATPRDLLLRQSWRNKEPAVVEKCKARAAELGLQGVKIVQAEYSFDGSRLVISLSTEADDAQGEGKSHKSDAQKDRLDLKSLRQDMQKSFSPAQVEIRQIGPRDVAKYLGGMGACGLESRCCSRFIQEFNSISIRMAKEQNISLTPAEITGMCGRLRCCLFYEYDNYISCRLKLPKKNKRVLTPMGEGKVVDVVPLRMAVIVEIPGTGYREFSQADISLCDESNG